MEVGVQDLKVVGLGEVRGERGWGLRES